MRFSKKKLKDSVRFLSANTTKLSGTVFRVVGAGLVEVHGPESIIAGKGPKEYGAGRWLAKSVCYALYTSFSIEIAIREVIKPRFGDVNKFVLARVDVNLDNVLDLTLDANLRELNAIKEDLAIPYGSKEESYTQLIGRYAYEMGIQGLNVPSAVNNREANLVVFSDETPVLGAELREWEEFES